MRALILKPGDSTPTGLLGEWCAARGIEAEVVGPGSAPALAGVAFVACLGSRFNPGEDADEPSTRWSLDRIRDAVETDVPVLGLCFGGQALSVVLGGSCAPTPCPELGWIEIDTDDPEAVPVGPWLAWHRHRFTVPPGATEIARNDSGPQAFRHGRHLATQFHPESTIEIVGGWGNREGVDIAHLEAGRAKAEPAARNAFQLFDAFERSVRDAIAA